MPAGWSLPAALAFGSLIAATDPVSVIAAFREARTPERLRVLVEGESLLNDGTAAVLFTLVLGFVSTGRLPVAEALTRMSVGIPGGAWIGALCALLVVFPAGRTKDHLVEVTFSVVAASIVLQGIALPFFPTQLGLHGPAGCRETGDRGRDASPTEVTMIELLIALLFLVVAVYFISRK